MLCTYLCMNVCTVQREETCRYWETWEEEQYLFFARCLNFNFHTAGVVVHMYIRMYTQVGCIPTLAGNPLK